jgi:ABC-type sugar transport system ATPase subunit
MEPIVKMIDITKEFSGVRVLNNVNFDVKTGEIHCLVGLNGAGKTTLIKILTGIYKPTKGKIIIYGKEESLNPEKARKLGIIRVPQDPELVEDLTVAENILMINMPGKVFVNPRKMYEMCEEALGKMGFNLDVKKLVRDCSRAEKQIVMLARIFFLQPSVVIFDEVTAPLGVKEQETVYKLIEELKNKGVGVVYISHRLEEVFKIGDRVTVLRNGEVVRTKPIKELSLDELISYIAGEELKMREVTIFAKKPTEEKLFEIRNLNSGPLKNINLVVRRGEVVGVFGLLGAGKTELAEAIYGIRKVEKGEIYLRGQKITINSPKDAIRFRIGLLPEDRDKFGLVPYQTVAENIILPSINAFKNFLFLDLRRIRSLVRNFIKELGIKPPSETHQVRFLSGGNKQKVILARWLASRSDVLLFDEPTKGIDVVSKREIYSLIRKAANDGKAVIIFSCDLDEILMICDYIYILHKGEIIRELKRENADKGTILKEVLLE